MRSSHVHRFKRIVYIRCCLLYAGHLNKVVFCVAGDGFPLLRARRCLSCSIKVSKIYKWLKSSLKPVRLLKNALYTQNIQDRCVMGDDYNSGSDVYGFCISGNVACGERMLPKVLWCVYLRIWRNCIFVYVYMGNCLLVPILACLSGESSILFNEFSIFIELWYYDVKCVGKVSVFRKEYNWNDNPRWFYNFHFNKNHIREIPMSKNIHAQSKPTAPGKSFSFSFDNCC